MTKTQETILACLQHNLDKAKTESMREFCQQQLAGFKSRIKTKEATKRAERVTPKAFLRFLSE